MVIVVIIGLLLLFNPAIQNYGFDYNGKTDVGDQGHQDQGSALPHGKSRRCPEAGSRKAAGQGAWLYR